MADLKNPFAMNNNNKVVYILDLEENDRNSEFFCPKCGDKLLPRMGKKNRWHFAHCRNKDCTWNFESGLHKYAKELIKNNTSIKLPKLNNCEYLKLKGHSFGMLRDSFLYDTFFEEGNYEYVCKGLEIYIGDIKPDIIIETFDKQMIAVEILVTHEVDIEKKAKVKNVDIDMVEIDLSLIWRLIDSDQKIDLDNYILYDAPRRWINKIDIDGKEKKLIEELNKKEEERKKEEQIKKQKKQEQGLNRINLFKRVLLNFEKFNQDVICIYNFPVKGEYAFKCTHDVWEKEIYNMFIRGRVGKNIVLAKINSYVEKYSERLKYLYYKELEFDKENIWDSKCTAIKNYLYVLGNLGMIKIKQGGVINYWDEIEILHDNVENEKIVDIIHPKDKKYNVCKRCGVIFDISDEINNFYFRNFDVCKSCIFDVIEEIERRIKKS